MDEKTRAEFEAWAVHQGYDLARDDVVVAYASEETDRAWAAWQASRAALEIEMPPQLDADDVADEFFGPVDLADAVNDAINGCRAAIEAAGVRVKP